MDGNEGDEPMVLSGKLHRSIRRRKTKRSENAKHGVSLANSVQQAREQRITLAEYNQTVLKKDAQVQLSEEEDTDDFHDLARLLRATRRLILDHQRKDKEHLEKHCETFKHLTQDENEDSSDNNTVDKDIHLGDSNNYLEMGKSNESSETCLETASAERSTLVIVDGDQNNPINGNASASEPLLTVKNEHRSKLLRSSREEDATDITELLSLIRETKCLIEEHKDEDKQLREENTKLFAKLEKIECPPGIGETSMDRYIDPKRLRRKSRQPNTSPGPSLFENILARRQSENILARRHSEKTNNALPAVEHTRDSLSGEASVSTNGTLPASEKSNSPQQRTSSSNTLCEAAEASLQVILPATQHESLSVLSHVRTSLDSSVIGIFTEDEKLSPKKPISQINNPFMDISSSTDVPLTSIGQKLPSYDPTDTCKVDERVSIHVPLPPTDLELPSNEPTDTCKVDERVSIHIPLPPTDQELPSNDPTDTCTVDERVSIHVPLPPTDQELPSNDPTDTCKVDERVSIHIPFPPTDQELPSNEPTSQDESLLVDGNVNNHVLFPSVDQELHSSEPTSQVDSSLVDGVSTHVPVSSIDQKLHSNEATCQVDSPPVDGSISTRVPLPSIDQKLHSNEPTSQVDSPPVDGSISTRVPLPSIDQKLHSNEPTSQVDSPPVNGSVSTHVSGSSIDQILPSNERTSQVNYLTTDGSISTRASLPSIDQKLHSNEPTSQINSPFVDGSVSTRVPLPSIDQKLHSNEPTSQIKSPFVDGSVSTYVSGSSNQKWHSNEHACQVDSSFVDKGVSTHAPVPSIDQKLSSHEATTQVESPPVDRGISTIVPLPSIDQKPPSNAPTLQVDSPPVDESIYTQVELPSIDQKLPSNEPTLQVDSPLVDGGVAILVLLPLIDQKLPLNESTSQVDSPLLAESICTQVSLPSIGQKLPSNESTCRIDVPSLDGSVYTHESLSLIDQMQPSNKPTSLIDYPRVDGNVSTHAPLPSIDQKLPSNGSASRKHSPHMGGSAVINVPLPAHSLLKGGAPGSNKLPDGGDIAEKFPFTAIGRKTFSEGRTRRVDAAPGGECMSPNHSPIDSEQKMDASVSEQKLSSSNMGIVDLTSHGERDDKDIDCKVSREQICNNAMVQYLSTSKIPNGNTVEHQTVTRNVESRLKTECSLPHIIGNMTASNIEDKILSELSLATPIDENEEITQTLSACFDNSITNPQLHPRKSPELSKLCPTFFKYILVRSPKAVQLGVLSSYPTESRTENTLNTSFAKTSENHPELSTTQQLGTTDNKSNRHWTNTKAIRRNEKQILSEGNSRAIQSNRSSKSKRGRIPNDFHGLASNIGCPTFKRRIETKANKSNLTKPPNKKDRKIKPMIRVEKSVETKEVNRKEKGRQRPKVVEMETDEFGTILADDDDVRTLVENTAVSVSSRNSTFTADNQTRSPSRAVSTKETKSCNRSEHDLLLGYESIESLQNKESPNRKIQEMESLHSANPFCGKVSVNAHMVDESPDGPQSDISIDGSQMDYELCNEAGTRMASAGQDDSGSMLTDASNCTKAQDTCGMIRVLSNIYEKQIERFKHLNNRQTDHSREDSTRCVVATNEKGETTSHVTTGNDSCHFTPTLEPDLEAKLDDFATNILAHSMKTRDFECYTDDKGSGFTDRKERNSGSVNDNRKKNVTKKGTSNEILPKYRFLENLPPISLVNSQKLSSFSKRMPNNTDKMTNSPKIREYTDDDAKEEKHREYQIDLVPQKLPSIEQKLGKSGNMVIHKREPETGTLGNTKSRKVETLSYLSRKLYGKRSALSQYDLNAGSKMTGLKRSECRNFPNLTGRKFNHLGLLRDIGQNKAKLRCFYELLSKRRLVLTRDVNVVGFVGSTVAQSAVTTRHVLPPINSQSVLTFYRHKSFFSLS